MNDLSILQFQQMLNAAPDPRFTALYPNYAAARYYQPLIQELFHTLQAYRDVPCQYGFRNGAAPNPSLKDLICLTSSLYNPVPLTAAQLDVNSQLVDAVPISNGANGAIYSPDPLVIIKVSTQDNAPELLRETFFNYRIVNEFILRGLPGLVDTYGFYFCDKPAINVSRPVCNPPVGTGFPWLNLVQENIRNSITFRKALRLQNIEGQILDENGHTNPLYDNIGVATLAQVQGTVSIIFSILIAMQESPYQVNHNDLHPGNILILPGWRVKIIDWGLSSYTFQGTRYKSSLDADYTGADMLNSGAHDAFFLLNEIFSESPVQNIRDWARQCLNTLFHHRLSIRQPDGSIVYKNPIVQDPERPWLLIILIGHGVQCYNNNFPFLNTLTYRSICNQLAANGIVITNYPIEDRAAPFPVPAQVPIVNLVQLGKKSRTRNN